MTKQRWIKNENIDPVYLDITTWPIVHEDKLDPKDRQVFMARKRAVELYICKKYAFQRS
jgi:putative transposase